jgi:DNA polymerase elongation subunit (family B)/ribosomal protein S14
MSTDKKFKRLFFDIETSYNVVSSWNIGRDIHINHDNIIKERAIICICYKWEHEKQVHSFQWNKGDDKKMLIDFMAIMAQASEIVGQNSDDFDIKWIRTRCIFHNIPMFPDYQSVDTLKLSRSGFRFNSNKLDYLGKFLGFGGKEATGGFQLWKDIVEKNSSSAMSKMIKYCKRDVLLLQKVFAKLKPYVKSKSHVGVIQGKDKTTCPECGSDHTVGRGWLVMASGLQKQRHQCQNCGKYFSLAKSVLIKKK